MRISIAMISVVPVKPFGTSIEACTFKLYWPASVISVVRVSRNSEPAALQVKKEESGMTSLGV